MEKSHEYLGLCIELGVSDLEGITMDWRRNGRVGNYLIISRNDEVIEEVTDPARLDVLSHLVREIQRSKEEVEIEESLWKN